ncbi:50S ribosomal protein L23 [Candidatus Methylospira mobilis]|uniref:Large ribosomal subunit protein uL23 n=1 Tax=Candidatus Methylospira mobilis TaxID=1808979 RepID=A0A5Q0BIK6_9GAMM|nr:50S ribosomal protein L23 [Candidatus Methylospira mobilis]QFY43660.1 50S ribosomal protein L23 [Candidatus Methylospira mobilis]WNV04648.1 50S ribosomal protein L23 [Candidatus Methylospira mobilis]
MRQQNLMRVIQAPIVSEKSNITAQSNRTFVFRVKKNSDKIDIKQAVELMFDVKVESVHVLNVFGKSKRFGRFAGKRSDWKKAYVKLKPGFDIELSTA